MAFALFVGAIGKRQAERDEVAGEGIHRPVVPEMEGLAAPLAADLACALGPVLRVVQAVIRIVGDRFFPGGGLAGIVHAEVFAHCIAAHGPAEGLIEFGEVDGCCHYEDLTR